MKEINVQNKVTCVRKGATMVVSDESGDLHEIVLAHDIFITIDYVNTITASDITPLHVNLKQKPDLTLLT